MLHVNTPLLEHLRWYRTAEFFRDVSETIAENCLVKCEGRFALLTSIRREKFKEYKNHNQAIRPFKHQYKGIIYWPPFMKVLPHFAFNRFYASVLRLAGRVLWPNE